MEGQVSVRRGKLSDVARFEDQDLTDAEFRECDLTPARLIRSADTADLRQAERQLRANWAESPTRALQLAIRQRDSVARRLSRVATAGFGTGRLSGCGC